MLISTFLSLASYPCLALIYSLAEDIVRFTNCWEPNTILTSWTWWYWKSQIGTAHPLLWRWGIQVNH